MCGLCVYICVMYLLVYLFVSWVDSTREAKIGRQGPLIDVGALRLHPAKLADSSCATSAGFRRPATGP